MRKKITPLYERRIIGMILTILLSTLFIVGVVLILVGLLAGGGVFMMLFGDVIVFCLIIGLIIKLCRRKKKRGK